MIDYKAASNPMFCFVFLILSKIVGLTGSNYCGRHFDRKLWIPVQVSILYWLVQINGYNNYKIIHYLLYFNVQMVLLFTDFQSTCHES